MRGRSDRGSRAGRPRTVGLVFLQVIGRDRLIRLEQGGDVDRLGRAGRPVQPVFELAQQRAGLVMVAEHGHELGRRGTVPARAAAPVADQQPLELGVLAG